MKFEFEQRFPSDPADVIEVYLDESFWSDLDGLSTTRPPTVLDLRRGDGTAEVRLHWTLSVDLPREAARFIDPDAVAWVEVTRWNLRERSASVEFLPDQAAGLLAASATAKVTASSSGSTRTVDGELRVRVPLLGHKVEPVIVEGVGDHLAEEADAVTRRLSG